MEKFAFIIHPISARRDIARHKKYWPAQFLPERAIEAFLKAKAPSIASHITGIKSPTGAEAEGWFIGCPLTPRQFLELPVEFVYERLVQCGRIAEDLGAKIIGLGAFTSVAGDGGITVAKSLNIAVTTGNSYTVATAIEATLDGAVKMGHVPANCRLAIVGATGSIGRTCAHILGSQAAGMVLIGRDPARLASVRSELPDAVQAVTGCSVDVASALRDADLVITVTSAVDVVIQPSDLKPGAVVCDVARPRDVSVRVAKERDDVLVIEGGVVAVPGDVDFRFNFGFPERTAYACMSETMMLALDGRYESLTLGKTVSPEQVQTTQTLAKKHGFKLAGYRSFEKAVTDEQIARIRTNAESRRLKMAAQTLRHPVRVAD